MKIRLRSWVALILLGPLFSTAQTPYPRAGWETHFVNVGHGVKGTATIIDARTIRLTHFSYDGRAPDMFVYVGTNRSAVAMQNGLTVSPRLARAYNNETYTVQLPTGQTWDGWNAVSIWCRLVQQNYGWGTFAPPVYPAVLARRRTNAVEITVTGEAGQRYYVQSNTNLMATNQWQNLVLLTNLTGSVRYTNAPIAIWPGMFYRALRE